MSNSNIIKKVDLNNLYKNYHIVLFNNSNQLDEKSIDKSIKKNWKTVELREEEGRIDTNNEWRSYFINKDLTYYHTGKLFKPNSIILSNNSNQYNDIYKNDYILYYNHVFGLKKMTSLVNFINGLNYDISNHKVFYNIDNNYIKEVNKKLYFNNKAFDTTSDTIYGIAKINNYWFDVNTGKITIKENILRDIRDIKNILYEKNKALLGLYEYVQFINRDNTIKNEIRIVENLKAKDGDEEYDITINKGIKYMDVFYTPQTKIFYKNNYWNNIFNNSDLSSEYLLRINELSHNNIIYAKNLKDIEIITCNSDKYYLSKTDQSSIINDFVDKYGEKMSIIKGGSFIPKGSSTIENIISDADINNPGHILFGAGDVEPIVDPSDTSGEEIVSNNSQPKLSDGFISTYFGKYENNLKEMQLPDNLFFTYIHCDVDNDMNKFTPIIKRSSNYKISNKEVSSYFTFNYINTITDKKLFEKNGLVLNTKYNIDSFSYTLPNYEEPKPDYTSKTINCDFIDRQYNIHLNNQNYQNIKILYDFRDINKLFYNKDHDLHNGFDYFFLALNYDKDFLYNLIDDIKFSILKDNNLLYENKYKKILLGCNSKTSNKTTIYSNFSALYNDFSTKIIKDVNFSYMTFNKDEDLIDINDLDFSEPQTIYIYEIKEFFYKESTNKIYDINTTEIKASSINGLSNSDSLSNSDITVIKNKSLENNKKYHVLANISKAKDESPDKDNPNSFMAYFMIK